MLTVTFYVYFRLVIFIFVKIFFKFRLQIVPAVQHLKIIDVYNKQSKELKLWICHCGHPK